jgi:tetratricopeptide (TPR) repeat protein
VIAAALVAAAFAAGSGLRPASAHDDLVPTIERLRAETKVEAEEALEHSPEARAERLLQRGELERIAREFERAEADYAAALALAPVAKAARVALCRGALAADLGRWATAESLVAVALAGAPRDVRAHRLRATVLRARGRGREAIAALDAALGLPGGWRPGDVIERGRWARELDGPRAELEGLERALERDPASIPIALRACEVESELGLVDRALVRVERVVARCGERCFELPARRADLLERAGRPLEAEVERSAILAAMQSRPGGARPADRALQTTIEQQLEDHP